MSFDKRLAVFLVDEAAKNRRSFYPDYDTWTQIARYTGSAGKNNREVVVPYAEDILKKENSGWNWQVAE